MRALLGWVVGLSVVSWAPEQDRPVQSSAFVAEYAAPRVLDDVTAAEAPPPIEPKPPEPPDDETRIAANYSRALDWLAASRDFLEQVRATQTAVGAP